MDKPSVFNYLDYKSFLRDRLDWEKSQTSGGHSRLAKAMNCQSPYLSRVLNGNAHLSLEQIMEANTYFGHNPAAGDYLMNLLQFNRAGTQKLKEHFKNQIDSLKNQQMNLKTHFQKKKIIDEKDQAIYYSSWLYLAIHGLVSIPTVTNAGQISELLNVELSKVNQVIDFLSEIGLIQESANGLETTNLGFHLGNDSPFIEHHHRNWRTRTLEVLDRVGTGNNINYTSVITLSENDIDLVRQKIIDFIAEIKKIIKQSDSEKLKVFNLDFFDP